MAQSGFSNNLHPVPLLAIFSSHPGGNIQYSRRHVFSLFYVEFLNKNVDRKFADFEIFMVFNFFWMMELSSLFCLENMNFSEISSFSLLQQYAHVVASKLV